MVAVLGELDPIVCSIVRAALILLSRLTPTGLLIRLTPVIRPTPIIQLTLLGQPLPLILHGQPLPLGLRGLPLLVILHGLPPPLGLRGPPLLLILHGLQLLRILGWPLVGLTVSVGLDNTVILVPSVPQTPGAL